MPYENGIMIEAIELDKKIVLLFLDRAGAGYIVRADQHYMGNPIKPNKTF